MKQVPLGNLTPRQRQAYRLRFRRGWRLRRIRAELGIASAVAENWSGAVSGGVGLMLAERPAHIRVRHLLKRNKTADSADDADRKSCVLYYPRDPRHPRLICISVRPSVLLISASELKVRQVNWGCRERGSLVMLASCCATYFSPAVAPCCAEAAEGHACRREM